MPYRRLPNTDTARIKALKTAIDKASNSDFQEVAFSMKTFIDAQRILSQFEKKHYLYKETYRAQVNANRAFQQKARSARIYLSHFIQVLYMCIIRNEIKEGQLKLYGLEHKNMLVPDLATNESLLFWGEKIIKGESLRVANGGVPIYNPSIAKVKVMYSLFKEGYNTQQIYRKTTERILNEVALERGRIDEIILKVWDEVEKHHMSYPTGKRVQKNRQYGIIYYYRKGETIK